MPPTFLINSLNGLRRKVKMLSVAFGIGMALTCAAAFILGSVLVDFVSNYVLSVPLPGGMRMLFLMGTIVGLTLVIGRWVAKPIMSRLSLSDIAGHVETVFPEFDDRLRSTVDFIQGNVPGSDFMKEQTVMQATQMAQSRDLSQAVVSKPVWWSMSIGLAAVAILVASTFIPTLNRGFGRFFQPFADHKWPKRVEINPGALPTRVPVGARIDVSMALTKGDSKSTKALIYYQYDNGPVQKEYMIRGDSGAYTASLEARGEKLRVWMAAGDDQTDRKLIEVVPRLAINKVEATVTPPAYAQMPAVNTNLAIAPAFMVHGSNVVLSIGFNKELDPNKPVTFMIVEGDTRPDAKPPMTGAKWDRADPRMAVATWTATQSGRFRIQATDKDGFLNNALEEYEIVVKPDQLPNVSIETPRGNSACTPVAFLPLVIAADDDFGIASLRLIVDRIGTAAENANQPDAKKHWEIDLANWQKIDSNGERQRYRLSMNWELAKTLGTLKPGDVLEYCIEARDNYKVESPDPKTGQVVLQTHPPQFSGRLRISIVSEKEMIEQITNEVRSTADKTRQVQNNQRSVQLETKNLTDQTQEKKEFEKGDRAQMDNLANRQSSAISQTKTLEQNLDNLQKKLEENRVNDPELKDITRDAKDLMNQAAEKSMSNASQQLNKAQQSRTNSPNPEQQKQAQEQRNQAMNQAQKEQQQAADKLQKAIESMDKVGTLSQAIRQMEDIKKKQDELARDLKEIGKQEMGKTPDQMKPENKQKLEKNAAEQKALAEKMDQTQKSMEKMSQQMQRSDPNASQAMKKAAEQAQQQQISQNQQNAAKQAQQNQQANAQQAQQQAQLGIEVVLNTLKEAERRRLAQLEKQLDEAVKAIQELVRRQAGHNIDNLDRQGGDAWTKNMPKKEEVDVLYSKAQRDQKNKPPVPELGVLTSGQEQTERNTRNVAKAVEEMPEGQEITGHLVRAASQMGYAIVELRDKKLAAAYSPRQVDALAALEAALDKAEKLREKVRQQQRAQDAEALKQKFERIRDEQLAKVNKPTTEVEQARKPDGALPRDAAVRTGQLAGKQGEIGDEVKKLQEELKKLGGVIYTDAAKDIADQMGDVKDDLGKQKTGKPVQKAEARIVAQLNDMIESLRQEKEQSEFAAKSGGGGGGGGGGGSKLPTEVELRLLKARQLAVNRDTKEADQQPKAEQDKVELVELGNRQGRLRNLLDTLIKQATRGQDKLGPEPDPKDPNNKLDEEASKEEIDNKETDHELLTGDAKAKKETKQLNRVGDRMARSRQRLALDNDPGKLTQEIQRRIIIDIDDMIKQSQQQVASNSEPKPGQGQQQPKPGQGQQGQQQPGQGQPQPGGQQAAQESRVSPGSISKAELSNLIKETQREWGGISPRLRDAVIEGSGEDVVEKYKKMIEDYYRGVSTGGKR